jgi:hypothetical protein
VHKFNQALLGKWLWRYATENDDLWHKIIKVKHEEQDGGCVRRRFRVLRCGFMDTFAKGLWFKVGVGSKVHFWHDTWCGDQPLKQALLSLFSIARYKEAWVKDNFIWRNGIVEWHVIFVCSVQD